MATKAAKQETFIWEGKNSKGQKTEGEALGKSIALVKADLRRQGINPTKVKKKPKPLFGGGNTKILPADISIFARQLATMMDSGVPLVQSFEIIGKGHENQGMSDLLFAIKNDIEGGTTLSEALAKHPLQFDELFCNLVQAGEHAGILDSILDKIATYKEKTEALKTKIKKALTYPISVLVVALIVSVILLVFVVPTFGEMFQSFGADLPAFTQWVVGLSDFMIEDGWIVGLVIIGVINGFIQTKKRSRKFRENLDKLYLKLPIISTLTHASAVARFSRTLSTMFAAGVPLVEAMVSVAGASGNSVYQKAIMVVRDEIAQGTTLQASLGQRTDIFPNMLIQMVGIGEESGALDDMLSKVAEYYEAAVDDAVDNMTTLMEPIIMSFLAVVIGGLVIALYLPVFKMGEIVSQN